MRHLSKLVVLLAVCALGSAPRRALADPPKPADPAPPSDPKKPSDPPAEPPKPGEPAPEDPEEAKRKAEAEKRQAAEEEKKRLEEEEKEREADEAARKKKEGGAAEEEEPRAAVPPAPRKGPPGMVYLPPAQPPAEAKDKPAETPPAKPTDPASAEPQPPPPAFEGAVIGSKAEELAKLLGTRPPETRRQFDFERPQHRRAVREAYYDACEVTNAQYLVFLKEHARTYVCDGKYATLVDYAAYFLGTPADRAREDDVAWRQLAEGNKDRILAAMPDLADKPWPSSAKDAVLPKRDLVLMFFSLRPPDDWPGTEPHPERLNHPVRNVSGLDAEAFCEWAGKHLQTEFEYEWASRGPDAPMFPWGNIWHNNAEYCNWGAKVVDPKTHEADTWPVGSHPRGRSWVGAHDLVGNVAEWTSSPFYLYGGAGAPSKLTHEWLGAVNIIRGGTAVDQEQLVLRPAARNFIGTGVQRPPYMSNRYPWVGFRCAWWSQPGSNQAPYIERRIVRGGRIKAPVPDAYGDTSASPGDLDLDRVAGTVADNYSLDDAQNGVWVVGRTKSVVIIPRRSMLDTEAASEEINHGRAKTKDGLLNQTDTEVPMALLGAFHTDVKLPKVWVRKKLTPEEKAALQKGKKRGRSELPALVEGPCPPGSYILAIWHKLLVLVDSSREFVCALTPPGKMASLEVKKVNAGALPPCKVAVDDTVNLINGTLTLPLATGKSADPLLWIHVSFSLEAVAEDLSTPNGWR